MVHVQEDGVAGWQAGGVLEHDQVPDTRKAGKPVDQPPGESGRGRDTDMQHQLRGVPEGSVPAAASVGAAELAAAVAGSGAAVAGSGAAAGAILAAAT